MILATLLQAASSLAEHPGAMKMLETDPHGWTLSLVAVCVVFSALLVLFLLYSLSGGIFTGKFKRKPKTDPDAPAAAAIAMALHSYLSDEDEIAAIAAALHLYLSDSVHDPEPGFITIRCDAPSSWGNKSLTLRKTPRK
ncbi:MAG: OadG family protein [Bacteroidales bacterium]|nr:OadG family protein [Bacteroidales bacterium]